MREINIYIDAQSWLNEKPNAVINGKIREKNSAYVEIEDDSGYTQLISLARVFAIVYK